MRNYKSFLFLACACAVSFAAAGAQRDFKPNIVQGPATAYLGNAAQIEVPAGYEFWDGPTLRQFMKMRGEQPDEDMLGRLAPTSPDIHWAVYFAFNEIGYVKDDDKDKLDAEADKLLESYRKGAADENQARQKAGQPPIHIIGWQIPPRYNEASHNLEWAIRGSIGGEEILNFNTRLLGRKGVMEVILAVDPKDFDRTLPVYTNVMAGYTFQSGQTYAEYRKGDKVAKYGLAALITAGAAVGAAKLGLFAWLALFFKKAGKLVIVAVVAVLAFFRKIIAGLFGRRSENIPRT